MVNMTPPCSLFVFFAGFIRQNTLSTVEFSGFCVIVIAITSRYSCRREEKF